MLSQTGTAVARLQFQKFTGPEPQLSDCSSDGRLGTGTMVGQLASTLTNHGTVVVQLQFQCPTYHRNCSWTTAVPTFGQRWNRCRLTAVPTVLVKLLSETAVPTVGWELELWLDSWFQLGHWSCSRMTAVPKFY